MKALCQHCEVAVWIEGGADDVVCVHRAGHEVCAASGRPCVVSGCAWCGGVGDCYYCAGCGMVIEVVQGPAMPEDLDHPVNAAWVAGGRS